MMQYELLRAIIDKVHWLNENTKRTVFLDYAGHVKQISIRIYPQGWQKDAKKTKRSAYFDVDYDYSLEEINEWLEKITDHNYTDKKIGPKAQTSTNIIPQQEVPCK